MKQDITLLEYGDATMEVRSAMVPCKLKLSDQGIAVRNIKTGKVENISSDDISVVNWQRLSSGHGIRIFTCNGTLHRFGGFKESEQSKLEKFFKGTLNKVMTDKEFSVKGWNYGSAKFEGSVLSFEVGSLPAFEIPLNNVSGCNVGRNEVTMEFHQPDEVPTNLMEMRFHIPTSELAGEDPVDAFQQRVMDKASVLTATGETLCIFQEVHCLTPRGRYDIKIYPSFIQLHGKSFNFNLPVESVLRLFLLPHMDSRHHFFVVSLDPPIKQGQTRYPFLIMLFPGDVEDDVELALSEEELKEKYDGRLEKEMSGPQFELVSRLFKGICGRKIVAPGSFLGHSGNPCVSCSYKAAAGYLYPLERGFIYCYKPPIHLRNEEIISVNFARSGSTTRSFDFEVEVKNSVIHTFSSIEKGEYNRLFDYAKTKGLRIKNRGNMDGGTRSRGGGDDYNDSDADEPDHYMNRVRADADEYGDDGEDESTDEDFAPGEEGSDVAEEFDSDAPDSSDSDAAGAGGSGEEGTTKKDKPKRAKTDSEKPRKKRKKGDKDENKPKRAMSAYFLWLNATREEIKAKHPGIGVTDVSKKAGEMWRELKDKKEWEEKAAVGKERYEAEMKEYRAAGGGADSGGSKKSRKVAASVSASPSKAGSGGGFKSKEYIESEGSSDEGTNKGNKNKAKKQKEGKTSKKVKKEDSEVEEAAEEEEEEAAEEEEEDAEEEAEAIEDAEEDSD